MNYLNNIGEKILVRVIFFEGRKIRTLNEKF